MGEWSDDLEEYWDKLEKEQQEYEKAIELLKFLDIPFSKQGVKAEHLYNIFMDPAKCQELISKLKNKAFW